jgi:enoyl-CoA hydratase
MPFETLLVDRQDAVAEITINRPNKLNALDATVIAELRAAVEELGRDGTRVAILTGAGDKAFVAGADIEAMSRMTAAEAKRFAEAGQGLALAIESAPFVAIAAVNGFALGGGCELALACDFIYASERARFGQPEVNLGLLPGFGGTQRLARRIGLGRARELVYSGRQVAAERARELGLVNEVVPAAELRDRVRAVAQEIATKAPLAVAGAKRVISRGYDIALEAACELEATAFATLFASEDMREGTAAFLSKRAPMFKGR